LTSAPAHAAGAVEQIIASYFERVNADDIEGIAALFTGDATVRAPGFPELQGRAEIAQYYKRLLAPFAKHVDIPTRTIKQGSIAAVDVDFHATLANGGKTAFQALDVFEVHADGLIQRLVTWYDSHEARKSFAAALAESAPPAVRTAAVGALAELTPPRLRRALILVRRGQAFTLDGAEESLWQMPHPTSEPFAGRGLLLDFGDLRDSADSGGDALRLSAETILDRAKNQGCEARAGDVLLIAVGPSHRFVLDAEALGWASETGLAAIATDGVPALAASTDNLSVGVRWTLQSLVQDSRGDDVWDGLLSITPRNVLGRTVANAVFWR
jgi:ketosteroid isomerase-like protein